MNKKVESKDYLREYIEMLKKKIEELEEENNILKVRVDLLSVYG